MGLIVLLGTFNAATLIVDNFLGGSVIDSGRCADAIFKSSSDSLTSAD
eukprot:CAMPEP_0114475052 /NCGR_PEP_ID=MMETSP0104-20121206/13923_1 /TAXON_ID=37642 ORGANISM="Paraphysomonas imperforata, Strain PA2" /NCGR_SAMPLE_ID=MMETSP0104 /ASSEMBLY_ACC=CAM_ASM_000202 /LENGTH=47 /DNA_ID= /DNA_START= /DNA_END= /DNA_ORIENTATION=